MRELATSIADPVYGRGTARGPRTFRYGVRSDRTLGRRNCPQFFKIFEIFKKLTIYPDLWPIWTLDDTSR